MGDDSSRSIVKALKNEWSLFWEAIHSEEISEDKNKDPFESGTLEALSLNQVREMTKALIEDRKKLNQKLESVAKEIDLNSAKLESLRLVGAEDSEMLKRIHELHDLCQSMSNALSRLDKKLRMMREKENKIQSDLVAP
jgi:hypothetical protein